ncbi:hypothetical protein ACFFWD_30045 [Bradyrhizobium erythrophlei]|uniref:hypothetical protein n=1 Tax=Bradyrhizobium erythrophlei TaxID=1437360 RepID=UPI0035F0257A
MAKVTGKGGAVGRDRKLILLTPGPLTTAAAVKATMMRDYGSRADSPGIGTIVVWRHHVGIITSRTSDGRWVVKSGNYGRGVGERARSLAGAIRVQAALTRRPSSPPTGPNAKQRHRSSLERLRGVEAAGTAETEPSIFSSQKHKVVRVRPWGAEYPAAPPAP